MRPQITRSKIFLCVFAWKSMISVEVKARDLLKVMDLSEEEEEKW